MFPNISLQDAGFTSAGALIIMGVFWYAKSIRKDFDAYKLEQAEKWKEQSDKCKDHLDLGQQNFDKLENKLVEGLNRIHDRIDKQTESFMNFVRDFKAKEG
jgi:hypothetical protein